MGEDSRTRGQEFESHFPIVYCTNICCVLNAAFWPLLKSEKVHLKMHIVFHVLSAINNHDNN